MPSMKKIAAGLSEWKGRLFKGTVRKILWIALLVLILAGVGGFIYYKKVYLPSRQTAEVEKVQTAVVGQGDLLISATGTGTLMASRTVDLGFQTPGDVIAVNVEVGDRVQAGDLLAQVDDTDARIQYTQANRAFKELTSPAAIAAAQQAIADAQASLDDARSTLGYLISPSVLKWEGRVAEAEQVLAEAEARIKASPADEALKKEYEAAQEKLESAEKNLKGARDYYETVYVPANFKIVTRTDKYIAKPSEAEVLAARAAVAAAGAALAEGQYLYTALTGGDVPAEATGSGLVDWEQARLDLDAAQDSLDGTRIVAPIAGTIMAVDIEVGNSVEESSAVITIADVDNLYLEIYLDETDWNVVEVGDQANVTFDALPDDAFSGTVSAIDPELYTSNGTTVIKGMVQLDNTLEELDLPLGSSAGVEVIGAEAKDAVLVTVDALHKAGPDTYAVFVYENNVLRLRVIEVGLQDLLYAEVKSGLQPGEVVTTGLIGTK